MSLIVVAAEAEASDIRVTSGQDDYAFTMSTESQAHRCEVSGAFAVADFRVIGNRVQLSDCRSESPTVGVLFDSADQCQVVVTVVNGGVGVEVGALSLTNQVRITTSAVDTAVVCDGNDNQVEVVAYLCDQNGVEVGGDRNRVAGVVFAPDRHGVVVSGDYNNIQVTVDQPGGDADDTYDAVNITGTATRNMLTASRLGPRLSGNQTRYSVNLDGTGECNMVWGNDLGDPDDYANQPSIQDLANNTQWVYPNDATYGDNLTDCGSGS